MQDLFLVLTWLSENVFFAGRVQEKIMSQNNLAPYFGFIILNDYLASSRGSHSIYEVFSVACQSRSWGVKNKKHYARTIS